MSVLRNVKVCHSIEEADMTCVYPRNSARTLERSNWKVDLVQYQE